MDAPADPFDSPRSWAAPPADGSERDGPAPTRAAWAALQGELGRLRAELAERTRERDESTARFHALVEGNADGIMVVDRAGTIRFANQRACDLFGVPLNRLVGTPFGHPLTSGQTTEVDVLPAGRGGPVVVEMRVVLAQWEGQPACLACLREITDRKRAEESARSLVRAEVLRSAAEESSRRFRFLAEAGVTLASSLDHREALAALAHLCVPELADWSIVYCVGEDGRIDRVEVAHADEELGDLAACLRAQPLEDADIAPVAEVLATGRARVVERLGPEQRAVLIADPERLRVVEELGLASFALLPLSARKRNLGAIALVRADPGRPFTQDDLALAHSLASRAALAVDNARLYQTARATDQAKTDLIAVISHDLRTPLNSIIGYADLLEMGVGDELGSRTRDFVRRIRSSAEHQVHLIDQLLTFSRVEAGAVELRPQDVDLARLLEDVRVMVDPLAQRAGLRLTVEGPEGLIARTDPDALRQIVLNLATNAVKYTERGEVRMAAAREGEGSVVVVCDTGIGISGEHLPHVFDPFWQADPGHRGTGLGLSIVRRLARFLGGDVEVASEPGRGSTFTVHLPAEPPVARRPHEV